MSKKYILIFLFVVFVQGFSETTIGLDLSSFTALSLTNADMIYNQHEVGLKAKSQLSEDIFLSGSIGAIYYGVPQETLTTKDNIENSSYFYPMEFYVDEAYLSVKNFIFPGLDFIGGKQRISWGKADKINPTDILNPVDLTMATDLAKKIPVFALNLKYYFPSLEDTGLQLVTEPYANQSVMPLKLLEKRLTDRIKENATNVTSFEIDENWKGSITTPEHNINNGLVGVKLFGKAFGFDFSLNGVRRVNDIPYVKEIHMTNNTIIDFSNNTTNVVVVDKSYRLDYHRETEVGFDIAKDWGIFLSWIELSVTFPDETKTTTSTFSSILLTNMPVQIPVPPYVLIISTNVATNVTEEKTILKDPYAKFVIGLDKNFDGGWYINFQYAHGLSIERGYEDERLQDYFTLNIEKSFFDEKLKFRLYGMANVDNIIDRFKDNDIIKSFADNGAVIGAFEVSYVPIMGVNIKLGVMGIDGNGESTLTMYKDYDMAYFEISTSF
ncbi:MAG: hypothetical protein ACP5QT_00285 [Brevinematia bacterium]